MKNQDQSAAWNGPNGQAWVELQDVLEGAFQPFADRLVAALAHRPGRVLDVGCGAGATTLALARAGHTATGLDISEPLLALAQARAGHAATFLLADAQTHRFPAQAYDWIVSRFGVMFFDDPVAAFANLRQAAAPQAELRCITWRSPRENPFMTAAERAAAPFLPDLPPRQPGAPGQFGLIDPERIHAILAASGWANAKLDQLDIECGFPASELTNFYSRLGPLAQVLPQLDATTRERITQAVDAAFAPFVHGQTVRFTAACWWISATA